MTAVTSKITSKLKGLGVYQVVGGVVGVILILWTILNSQQLAGLLIVIYLFMLLFFAFSIFCGILCLKKNDNALTFSLTNQILQILGFAMFGFAFQYAASLYLTAGLNLTESFNLIFGAGVSKFDFNLNNDTQRFEVSFNFIALGLIIFIERMKKQNKEEKDKNQIASIATS